jgi:hypothetical protein
LFKEVRLVAYRMTKPGIDVDDIAKTEADHFMQCATCAHMRDLGQIMAHVHDAEIEIGEGPEPPRGGQAASKGTRASLLPIGTASTKQPAVVPNALQKSNAQGR